jgi:iron complex outermembrane receptor protein
MQYYTVSANSFGEFPPVAGLATAVSGVVFDTDPQGRSRAVFGASSGAIDHTIQDYVKARSGYAFNDWLELEGFVALWRNDSTNENRTFMRDTAGREIWSGRVLAEGVVFDVPGSALAPSERDERHLQWGTTLRTTRSSGWNGSLVYSAYEIREDSTREAANPDPIAVSGSPGTNVERDGTGWHTFEAQAVYTPVESDWTGGAHAISLGVHRNEYQLVNPIYATSDWRHATGTLVQNVFGETHLTALYAQDEWHLNSAWSLTLGVRYEDWSALHGGQRLGSVAIDYPSRTNSAWSPKASIAFAPVGADWSLRLSAGRGVRFPTVAELFQGTTTASSIIVNDPDLEPERSDSIDLTYERGMTWGTLRASLFQDDVRDSIFAQTNITVTPSVTNVQNVDRVRTRGIEAAFAIDRFLMDALSLEGSIAHARAKILENDNFPISVGNSWPRVPRWRGNLQAVWRPNGSWLASLGARYSGRMYNRLENDDVHPDTYGGVSRFTLFDARLAYTFANRVEIAVGIDNLTNERSYQSHPLQTRTGFVEARWSFEES